MANLDPVSILGPGGKIARRLPATSTVTSSSRWPGQSPRRSRGPATWSSRRARAWARASPTWSRRSRRRSTHKKKVVVSTHTIALQEQLLSKDIPFLRSVMAEEFSAVLVKGRSNYISLRRLNVAIQRQDSIFQRPEEIDQLATIRMWSGRTGDGSRSDLDFRPFPSVWEAVQSEDGNCLGRECPNYKECFFYQARRRVQNANMLIVNHALFVTDLALRAAGFGFCRSTTWPSSTRPIRSRPSPASTWACSSPAWGSISRWRGCTTNDRKRVCLLITSSTTRSRQVQRSPDAADDFFDRIADWHQRQPAGFNGRRPDSRSAGPRSCPRSCAGWPRRSAKARRQIEQPERANRARPRPRCAAGRWRTRSRAGLRQTAERRVYWVELEKKTRRRVRLAAAPLDVGPNLRSAAVRRGSRPAC